MKLMYIFIKQQVTLYNLWNLKKVTNCVIDIIATPARKRDKHKKSLHKNYISCPIINKHLRCIIKIKYSNGNINKRLIFKMCEAMCTSLIKIKSPNRLNVIFVPSLFLRTITSSSVFLPNISAYMSYFELSFHKKTNE